MCPGTLWDAGTCGSCKCWLMPHHCPAPVPAGPLPLSILDPFLEQARSSVRAGAAAPHVGAPSSITHPSIPGVPVPHPAAHATQPLWKSRDWGALQRSDAAASPWQRVTSCLGAQGLGSPGPTGACLPRGGVGPVCGYRDRDRAWVWVSLCTQHGLTQHGWARGYGVLKWRGSPSALPLSPSPDPHPHPELCHRPWAGEEAEEGHAEGFTAQMEQWDRGLSPTVAYIHLWVQERREPNTLHCQGLSGHSVSPGTPRPSPGGPEDPCGVVSQSQHPQGPDTPVQHCASPFSKSQWEPGLTIS